ncbi:hypothetical protein SEA_MOAB_150 [Streptomyces phage Moab]|nr:hypothetical protein SEA_MOAB_150 [Streptomyces phage Moab]
MIPDADSFDDIIVCPHEEDYTIWQVIGVRAEFNALKRSVLQDNIANKPLAEAFVRWYTDKYWNDRFGGAQDC